MELLWRAMGAALTQPEVNCGEESRCNPRGAEESNRRTPNLCLDSKLSLCPQQMNPSEWKGTKLRSSQSSEQAPLPTVNELPPVRSITFLIGRFRERRTSTQTPASDRHKSRRRAGGAASAVGLSYRRGAAPMKADQKPNT